jgi:hypothetical protein
MSSPSTITSPQIDADAIDEIVLGRRPEGPLRFCALDLHCTAHGVYDYDAGELGKEGIADRLDQTPMMGRDAELEHIVQIDLEARAGPFFIAPTMLTVFDDICEQNGGKAALHLSAPEHREPTIGALIQAMTYPASSARAKYRAKSLLCAQSLR